MTGQAGHLLQPALSLEMAQGDGAENIIEFHAFLQTPDFFSTFLKTISLQNSKQESSLA